jgi:hypothetical protein
MIVLAVFNYVNDLVTGGQTCTDPGALTERFDATSTGGADCQTSHASALQAAGPTATGNLTWTQTDAASQSMVWAIKPAAGGGSVNSGVVATDGEGALSGVGASTAASAIASDGDGQFSAVGAALAASVFSTDGEGDFQAVGAEVISGALNAEGEAELAASGASIASSILNIDGESEFTATGASIATCVLNADGEAEFVAEGSSISDGSGVFEATGEGEFTAVGASIADGALTAEGEGDFIVVSEAVVTPGTPEATVSPRPDGGGAYAHDANPWARINARKKKQMREEDEDFLAALRELAPHIFNSRTIH